MSWLLVALALIVGYMFWDDYNDDVAACLRGTESALERADIAERVGAYQIQDSALERADLDCGRAVSPLP
jgi:hypothetical protein